MQATAARAGSGRPQLLQALIDAFKIPDLRAKLLFTLAMLVVFRFIAHVPVPGVDRDALNAVFSGGQFGELLGFLDLFSGGALRNLSIVALGQRDGHGDVVGQLVDLLSTVVPLFGERLQLRDDRYQ